MQTGLSVPQDTDSSVLPTTTTTTQRFPVMAASTLRTSEAGQKPLPTKIVQVPRVKSPSISACGPSQSNRQ